MDDYKVYDYLVVYLEQVRKPRNMTELQLATRLRTIQSYSTYLPASDDPQNVLTNLRIKKIYFHMQPMSYQAQYNISKPRIEDNAVTLMTMAEFFSELETLSQGPTTNFISNRNN